MHRQSPLTPNLLNVLDQLNSSFVPVLQAMAQDPGFIAQFTEELHSLNLCALNHLEADMEKARSIYNLATRTAPEIQETLHAQQYINTLLPIIHQVQAKKRRNYYIAVTCGVGVVIVGTIIGYILYSRLKKEGTDKISRQTSAT
jgi:hypothetical protein